MAKIFLNNYTTVGFLMLIHQSQPYCVKHGCGRQSLLQVFCKSQTMTFPVGKSPTLESLLRCCSLAAVAAMTKSGGRLTLLGGPQKQRRNFSGEITEPQRIFLFF